jgi:menaquinone-specific isochorismate synthase
MTKLQLHDFLSEGAFVRKSLNTLVIFVADPNREVQEPGSFARALTFFTAENEPWLDFGFGGFEVSIQDFVAELEALELPHFNKLGKSHFSEPIKSDFESAFRDCQQKIHRGEIEKSVPISKTFARAEVTHSLIRDWVLNALKAPKTLYPYGIWKKEKGVIGASPELLFERSGLQVKTMALAGTCPKSEVQSRSPLMKDAKELREHFLVIKDIRDQLGRFGAVAVSPTEVVELPRLFHLKTEISVQTTTTNESLIKALHPTPALGVFPRNYGLNWLKTQPYQNEREVFGGPIAFVQSEAEAIVVVAIRNLIWSHNEVSIFVGCGLVSDSQVDREWEELLEKRNSVFDIFGMSDL